MSSRKLYDRIYASSIGKLEASDIAVDDHLVGDGKPDRRMGVSLIIGVRSIATRYKGLLASMRRIEPDQYYYPVEDLHITVFDFIRGRESYRRDEESERLFMAISQKAAKRLAPFDIELEGIVCSAEAGLVQGYDGDALIELREAIRGLMEAEGLMNEERYRSESAHMTFMRFRKELARPDALCAFVGENRELRIGRERVAALELVEHDWYNRKAMRRAIGSVALKAD